MSESMLVATHRFVKRLTATGMAPRLAEALTLEVARVYPCNFLTKPHVEPLTTRMIARIRQTAHEIIMGTLIMMRLTAILVIATLKL